MGLAGNHAANRENKHQPMVSEETDLLDSTKKGEPGISRAKLVTHLETGGKTQREKTWLCGVRKK